MTTLLGIDVPSSDPIFIAIVFGVHIPLGIACAIAGLAAMFSKKGSKRHVSAGTIYFWGLAALFGSAAVLSLMRWAADWQLLLFGAAAFTSALFGRTAARMKLPHWARLHMTSMGLSYAIMLSAFYVDNGHQLPIWKDLPPILYWLLPIAVAIPLLGRALLTHPLRNLGRPWT